MKSNLSFILALAAFTSAANGAIYTFNNVAVGPGDTLYANSANALSSGTIVSVGYFALGFDLNANLNNRNALLANYTILSSVTTGSTSESLDPLLTTFFPGYTEYAPIDTADITTPDLRIGLSLYSFNGDAATLGASTQFSLFVVGTILDDVPNEADYLVNPAGVTPLIGTLGVFSGDAGGGDGVYKTLQTAAIVPEPSAAFLGTFGALFLLRRRRV